jgi:hypothetical protein
MAPRILQMLRDHTGDAAYHPLCALLSLAQNETALVSDRINIHKTIAKYVEPELKQIEYSGARDKPPITLHVVLDDAEAE